MKLPTTKPEDSSVISGAQMIKRENQVLLKLSSVLHVCAIVDRPIRMQNENKLKYENKHNNNKKCGEHNKTQQFIKG